MMYQETIILILMWSDMFKISGAKSPFTVNDLHENTIRNLLESVNTRNLTDLNKESNFKYIFPFSNFSFWYKWPEKITFNLGDLLTLPDTYNLNFYIIKKPNKTKIEFVTETVRKHIRSPYYYDEPDNLKYSRFTKSKPNILWLTNNINNSNVIKEETPVGRNGKKSLPSRPISEQSKSNGTTKFLDIIELTEIKHVACISKSGLDGTCLHEYACKNIGGITVGPCNDGYTTCCVIQLNCGKRSSADVGWFVNSGFPRPSRERSVCALTIYKSSLAIRQIRLDMTNFELLPPTAGTCKQDKFMVTGQNINNIVPVLCGINSGQHVYIEVGDVDGPITLAMHLISEDVRLFSIKFTQLKENSELAAPAGCLQYFQEPAGYLEPFNYEDNSESMIAKVPSYLNDLNYAMCIKRHAHTCSVTYENSEHLQIVNYDTDGRPLIPPCQAGVETFDCPDDWLSFSASRFCGERLNDGSVLGDFTRNAPITDTMAGPVIVWFRSNNFHVGRGFKIKYEQISCITPY